ncbi:MCE family protein [Nocardioides sp. YIM B13467]|uniref:MCE family protein n=1 Tax=Nocardioides sp. YIM B13467 TaxID=3366294 RepID=UPI00366F1830
MTRPTMSLARLRDAFLGLCYLAVVAAVALGAWLAYDQTFVDRSEVTLTTGTLGNALQVGSDVKLRGVPVGTVRTVSAREGGAELTLALEPDVLSDLSADTTARLLPKTLFGERYVALQPASGPELSAGDTIEQDRSDEAVELEQVLDELLPVLKAIQPHKLNATLSELATMLRDNGDDIGQVFSAWADYLRKLNPLVPQMADDLAALGRVAGHYEEAAPDLLDALDTMTLTAETLVDQQRQLADTFRSVTTTAADTDRWLERNRETIVVLSDTSRDALGAVSPYASSFPCLFSALRDYAPAMAKNLGKGTDEPGFHALVSVSDIRQPYPSGYVPKLRTGGPRCPYVTGQTGSQPAVTGTTDTAERIEAPPTDRVRTFGATTGLGEQNSKGENQLIAEVMAPAEGLAPDEYPTWSSLLLGPTLRGTEVIVR